jgi:hypothetical protein
MLTRSMTQKYYKSDEYKREICGDDVSVGFLPDLIRSLIVLGVDKPSVIVMGRKYYVSNTRNKTIMTDFKPTINKAQSIIDDQSMSDAQIPLSNDVYQTIYDLLCEVEDSVTKNGDIRIHTQVEVKLLGRRFTIGTHGLNIENLFGEPNATLYSNIFPFNMVLTLRIE